MGEIGGHRATNAIRWLLLRRAPGHIIGFFRTTRAVVPIINVILEVSFFHRTIRINDSSFPVLEASRPFSFIYSAICKVHLTVAVSLIVGIVAFVDVA